MEKIKNPFENKDFGLYIHIPFCAKKCSYCAFNVNILNKIPQNNYLNKLIEELKLYDHSWKTIYIGGGTPNLLKNEFYKKLFEYLPTKLVEEITIELNPEFVTKNQIIFYKSLGINRFSLGIQTFNEKGLKILGRNHDKNQALNALSILKNENYSFDLIYGYPNQSIENLKKDLEIIKKIKPIHLSIYNLTYEEGAFFYKWRKKGIIKPLDDEIELKMYNLINKEVKKIGLNRYEISNFAKTGYESKHNMLYWTSHPYIGIGVASHSYYFEDEKIIRAENESKLRNYLQKKLQNIKKVNVLNKKEYVFDKFYSEMRKLYIDTDDFLLQTDIDLFDIFNKLPLEKFLKIKNNKLFFTNYGIINSDSIFSIFYEIVNSMDI